MVKARSVVWNKRQDATMGDFRLGEPTGLQVLDGLVKAMRGFRTFDLLRQWPRDHRRAPPFFSIHVAAPGPFVRETKTPESSLTPASCARLAETVAQ
jgi:hypothetical protein